MITHESMLMTGRTLIPFNSFLQENGRSASCGKRWRNKKWIQTVNIAGRLYVTPEEIGRFHRRAAAGEFAKTYSPGFVYDDLSILELKTTPAAQPEGDNQPCP